MDSKEWKMYKLNYTAWYRLSLEKLKVMIEGKVISISIWFLASTYVEKKGPGVCGADLAQTDGYPPRDLYDTQVVAS